MFQSKSRTSLTNKKTLLFGLISVFLCGMGFSIIMPVVPFLVTPYVTNASDQALMVTLLTSVYAFCVFFAAPGLGALSDRFGRRPVLLICFIGSAIGYYFGLGGALWVLFLARIIEGITGGSISTLFAFFADITPQEADEIFWLGKCCCRCGRCAWSSFRWFVCPLWLCYAIFLWRDDYFH